MSNIKKSKQLLRDHLKEQGYEITLENGRDWIGIHHPDEASVWLQVTAKRNGSRAHFKTLRYKRTGQTTRLVQA